MDTPDPDIFSSTPRDHPIPFSDERGHADIEFHGHNGNDARPFLNDGEEGGGGN